MYFINNAFDCVSEREPRLAPLAGLLILFAHIAAQSKCGRLQRLPLFVWTLDAYLCGCATSPYTLCSVTPYPTYIKTLSYSQSSQYAATYFTKMKMNDNRRVASFPFCFASFLFHCRRIQETVSLFKKKKLGLSWLLTQLQLWLWTVNLWPFFSLFCSASGASVVAIDNKIEQAMVSWEKLTQTPDKDKNVGCTIITHNNTCVSVETKCAQILADWLRQCNS